MQDYLITLLNGLVVFGLQIGIKLASHSPIDWSSHGAALAIYIVLLPLIVRVQRWRKSKKVVQK